jgi:hypothetical protein
MTDDRRPRTAPLGWIALAGCFVAVLAYATVTSSRAPAESGAARGGPGAAEACKAAVRGQLSGARFPFPTSVVNLGNDIYRLHGTLDAPLGDEVVRRNYECVIRYVEAKGYRADSVRVWQSH